jgi:putative CocE/NonD family hydrolase
MRDGVNLTGDAYLPDGAGPFPVLLARSVYGRADETLARPFVDMGIVFMPQDTRGRGGSEGTDRVFADDGWDQRRQDGADTVAWILEQPWCNGRIGTWGMSALGITQVLMAPVSPQLVCQSIQVAPIRLYGQMTYRGGVWHKSQCENWLTAQGNAHVIPRWKAHPAEDSYWKDFDAEPQSGRIGFPTLHIGGWWDMFSQGTLDNFSARQDRGADGARDRQILVMGPWVHNGPYTPRELAGVELPENWTFDVAELERRFYRHWLLGEDTGIATAAPVRYYTLGALGEPEAPGNEWRTAKTWPPFPTRTARLYLDHNGGLQPDTPPDKGAVSYVYDPADPCPTLGGNNFDLPPGPFEQSPVAERSDVLTFVSPPLDRPMEICGRVTVRLFVSSDAPDTDFSAKLLDVYPDGRQLVMLDGIQRVKYRKGTDAPAPLLQPGEVVRVDVDLWSISLVLNRGHSVGLQISSSSVPKFAVNPNTGADNADPRGMRTAVNTIRAGGDTPSHLILPVPAP